MLSFEANTFDGGYSCFFDLHSLFIIWSLALLRNNHTRLFIRDTHNLWTFLHWCRLNVPFLTRFHRTIKITLENTESLWFTVVLFAQRCFSAVSPPWSGPCQIFYTNGESLCSTRLVALVLFWHDGKHSQHRACLVLPDGRLKPIQTRIHSLWPLSQWMWGPPEGKNARRFVIRPHQHWPLLICVF